MLPDWLQSLDVHERSVKLAAAVALSARVSTSQLRLKAIVPIQLANAHCLFVVASRHGSQLIQKFCKPGSGVVRSYHLPSPNLRAQSTDIR